MQIYYPHYPTFSSYCLSAKKEDCAGKNSLDEHEEETYTVTKKTQKPHQNHWEESRLRMEELLRQNKPQMSILKGKTSKKPWEEPRLKKESILRDKEKAKFKRKTSKSTERP